VTRRLHLPFPDPAGFTGSHEEKLAQVREVRTAVKARMDEFIAWVRGGSQGPLSEGWQDIR
jgi:arsenate reductase